MLTKICMLALLAGYVLDTHGYAIGHEAPRGPGHLEVIDVSFDAETYMYLVEENFISFTLDSYAFLEHLRNFNVT